MLIAKPDTYFKSGSRVELIELLFQYENNDWCGIYKGVYVVGDSDYDKYYHNKGFKPGDEVIKSEVCNSSEFKEVA